ncbi:hypothetical protein NDU88_003817 [Pleurodeles waltl]|uniref:Secreted protein n=1 Tax=Pleurodeles waltl TaxID=8319 RepID=A0AAV7MRN6_PLEWA|nr:hypothetical protein NDU88_003817 [Pleurodeles waltl]
MLDVGVDETINWVLLIVVVGEAVDRLLLRVEVGDTIVWVLLGIEVGKAIDRVLLGVGSSETSRITAFRVIRWGSQPHLIRPMSGLLASHGGIQVVGEDVGIVRLGIWKRLVSGGANDGRRRG